MNNSLSTGKAPSMVPATTVNRDVFSRVKAALQCLFVGDALSMPAHWFYRPADILKAFPPNGIDRMHAAPEYHPGSVMSLHSTSRGGRGKQGGKPVVGEVILKGRGGYWKKPNMHYHQGMAAGENTLNAYCARLMLNWVSDQQQYDLDKWLEAYTAFMTADPPLHPDTYAESYHRGFFANYADGLPLRQCGSVTHDTPSMGALVTVAPLALALLPALPLSEVQALCRQHVWSTHPDDLLMQVVDAYVELMNKLMDCSGNGDLQACFCEAASVVSGGDISGFLASGKSDMEVVGGHYSLACYITDSWPSVCYLAARYFQNPERGLIVNTNLGGENAHRGSVLGTLLGLACGEAPESLYQQLAHHAELEDEIDRWLRVFYLPEKIH